MKDFNINGFFIVINATTFQLPAPCQQKYISNEFFKTERLIYFCMLNEKFSSVE